MLLALETLFSAPSRPAISVTSAGAFRSNWDTDLIRSRWNTDTIWSEWIVSFSTFNVSHLSTEYILIPVSVTIAGQPYNPGSDTVQFAFMPNAVQQPAGGDWVNGSWETVPTNFIYPYNAKCLVGPSGATVLTLGTYAVYLKIIDNPEIPVRACAQLTIT